MPPPTSTNVDPASGARCQADADADVADEARRVSAPQPQRCARAGRRLVGRCSGLTHHLSLPTSAACTALHCTHSLLVDEHHLLSSSSGSRCTVGGLHLLSEMSAWRASLPGYRAVSQRLNAWVTRKPHRSEHVLQAMIGVNMIAGIVLLTQVQRWRLGSFDEQIADLSTAKPQLWEQYEREMADSIRISELREAELRAEAAERDALGLPPDYSAPERVVRTYNIDGRERRVVFINTNPIGFGVRLQEYRDKMEQQNLLTGATPPSSSAACTECLREVR